MENYKIDHLMTCVDLQDLYTEVFETYPNITEQELTQVFEELKKDFVQWLKDVNKDNLEDGEKKIFVNI